MHKSDVVTAHKPLPFRPFSVILSNQKNMTFVIPNTCTFHPINRSVVITDYQSGGLNVVDIAHIIEIRFSENGSVVQFIAKM